MSLLAVRRAFEDTLAAMPSGIATAWENVPYTPVAGTPYQRAFLLPAEPDNPEMGRFTQERGIFQINLLYPLGQGAGDALRQAERIRSTFYRGRTITVAIIDDWFEYYSTADGTVKTVIERTPEISPGFAEEDRFVLPVRVRFYANFFATPGVS